MQTEVVLKFKLPEDEFAYNLYYKQAQAFYETLNQLEKFIFNSESKDMNIFDIQCFYNDLKKQTGIQI
jgi:hypothetical protein